MNKNMFFNTSDPLETTVINESELFANPTLNPLDELDERTPYIPCTNCDKSNHLVESKVNSYKLKQLDQSQAYACAHCDVYKPVEKN